MLKNRRKFIKQLLSVAGISLTLSSFFSRTSLAANNILQKEKFLITTYNKVLRKLYKDPIFFDGKGMITVSRLPKTAENGAVVPISITTTLKRVDKISILVENNPTPLSVEFYLSLGVYPQVSARLKMAKASNVVVIVEAEGKLYRKTQFVKVTVGGCG